MRGVHYVGRVGGLAVALGIGISVVLGGAGAASADPADDGDPGRPSPSAAARGEISSETPRRASGTAVEPSRSRSTPAGPGTGPGVVAERREGPAPTVNRPVVPAVAAPVVAGAARTVALPAAPVRQTAPPPQAAPAAAALAPPALAAPIPATASRATATADTARVSHTVVGLLSGTGPLPVGPVESPVSWMVAAAARRGAGAKALASATGQAASDNPIATLFFNQTPALNPSKTGQDSLSVVSGDLNINDPDSDVEVYTVTAAPQRGSVEIDSDGRYTYTPDPQYERVGTTDTFTVTVSDAESGFHIHGIGGLLNLLTFGLLGDSGHASTATVNVVVDPRNTAPEATVTVADPNPVTGLVLGRVAGSDADGDPLTYTGSTTTSKGSATVAADGTFSYTPTTDARHDAALLVATEVDKTDTFAVTVADAYGGRTNVTVTVAISPLNEPPVGGVTVGSPDPATGVVTGRVAATDPEGDPLTYTGSTGTSKGNVTVAADGTFTYTPTAAARHAAASLSAGVSQKTDTFTVTVSDGSTGGTVGFPVTVTISPTNSAPIAGGATVGTPDATTGLVTGRISASDADGDPLSYSAAPTRGSISFTGGGNFSFTPTASARQQAANGGPTTEAFTVTISDGYGGAATQSVTVGIAPALAPPELSFSFSYGSGSEFWSTEARNALNSAAASLASYFVVSAPVTITVDVLGQRSPSSSNLAYASVDFTSYSPGYYGTIVQSKILTGVDSNGGAVDAVISYNWAQPWALGNSVGGRQYDFKAVAIHELLHTVGFLTGSEAPGVPNSNWTFYDRFLTTSDGTAVIGNDYTVIAAYAANFTGAGGGLYFTGPNAGRVQLYTPGTWAGGSSVSHVNQLGGYVMNPFYDFGAGPRVLSATEIGILRDLGYTVNNSPGVAAFVVPLLVRLRRRR